MMKFSEMAESPVEYNGRKWRAWWVEVRPFVYELFADVALQREIEATGGVDGWVDRSVGFYVDPESDVNDAIEEYNG